MLLAVCTLANILTATSVPGLKLGELLFETGVLVGEGKAETSSDVSF